jgi:hypothetical protein
VIFGGAGAGKVTHGEDAVEAGDDARPSAQCGHCASLPVPMCMSVENRRGAPLVRSAPSAECRPGELYVSFLVTRTRL